jgi:ribosomal protein L37E
VPDLRIKNKYSFYTCGRCGGEIPFLKRKGPPSVCPECGYGHGERGVNDVPSLLKLNLNSLSQENTGSRGITEETTITSR